MFTSFEEVSESYLVVFFDAFGVLKRSSGVIDGVPDLLRRLRARGKDLYLVTNDSSKSPAAMARSYGSDDGGALIPAGRIISSGLLATDFLLAKVRSGNVAYLGKPASAYYVEVAGLTPIPIAECTVEDDPRALVLLDDEGFDWFHDINRAVNLVRQTNVPVIVANNDVTYPVSDSDVGIAVGSLANMMETIVGKTFIRFGKPDPLMFSYAFERALSRRPRLTKRDVLMVGDTLSTDILGANKFGLDTVLTLTGNTLAEEAEVAIRSSGIIPTYVCESVLT